MKQIASWSAATGIVGFACAEERFHTDIKVPSRHKGAFPCVVHAERLPLHLQGLGGPVEYRNVWILNLEK